MGQAPPSKAQRIHFEGRNCDGIDSKFKQLRYEIFRCKTSRRVKGRLPSAPLRSPAHNVGDHASAKRGRIGGEGNAHRIDRAIIAELLRVSLLPWEQHEGAARWMERTIADAVKQRLRD